VPTQPRRHFTPPADPGAVTVVRAACGFVPRHGWALAAEQRQDETTSEIGQVNCRACLVRLQQGLPSER
jgi:hypothetical protein